MDYFLHYSCTHAQVRVTTIDTIDTRIIYRVPAVCTFIIIVVARNILILIFDNRISKIILLFTSTRVVPKICLYCCMASIPKSSETTRPSFVEKNYHEVVVFFSGSHSSTTSL